MRAWGPSLGAAARELAQGYAWVALLPDARWGVALAALTWADPVRGAFALLGALCAGGVAAFLGAGAQERPVAVFNGLLCALALGAPGEGATAGAWQALGAQVLLQSLAAAALAVLWGRWSIARLGVPVLSLPFSLVALLGAAAWQGVAGPSAWVAPVAVSAADGGLALLPEALQAAAQGWAQALAGVLLLGDAASGWVLGAVLLLASRYLALLALAGYGAAWAWWALLGVPPPPGSWGSNAVLAAMLVGGVLATPGGRSLALALGAAVLGANLSVALALLLPGAAAGAYALPFVLVAWLALRLARQAPALAHHWHPLQPQWPEQAWERSRLAWCRTAAPGSVALAYPGLEQVWTVSQGFGGEHTHHGPWRYALDFVVLREGRSFAGRGAALEDFPIYASPVFSPAQGRVCAVVDGIADNPPGHSNAQHNWGNHIVIALETGLFVLLAHLRPGTARVQVGQWVEVGEALAQCGNSGRSPQPHLHLHVQTSAQPGSPTVPFHLVDVLVHTAAPTPGAPAPEHYQLACVPARGQALVGAARGQARPLFALAGRGLRYRVWQDDGGAQEWSVHAELDAQGGLRLVSSAGGSCRVESTWAVFSCFDRDAVPDRWLDLWLLGCGFTPASMQVMRWQDQGSPARLLPQRSARMLARLLWPWGALLHSHYQREWDGVLQAWRQHAQHRSTLPGLRTPVRVQALLVPQLGCTQLRAHFGRHQVAMQALGCFQRADLGIPAWESPLQPYPLVV